MKDGKNGVRHRKHGKDKHSMGIQERGNRRLDAGDPFQLTPDTEMSRLFGFDWSELISWKQFCILLSRPSDPSSLAFFRISYGILMLIDIPQERGLAFADYRWGDPDECRFPLFQFLKPLPIQWMYVVYLVMIFGAAGITLGLLFPLSCLLFALPYWYLFFLDKLQWNNHSYLYGLISILLSVSQANRYWSLDSLIFKHHKNKEIPIWNYSLFRVQFFLVYFIAGLKKLDQDWVTGYSMTNLSSHWVFQPFSPFLTNEQIDLYIVHWCGLLLDLSMGFLLFFDATRKLAFFMGGMFHLMNSQIFSIGMFPYTMLLSHFMFLPTDWPKTVSPWLPQCLQGVLPSTEKAKVSLSCLYSKETIKSEKKLRKQWAYTGAQPILPQSSPSYYHKLGALLTIFYLCLQCFLPYSHFLTKGYNNWTNGLYGYSWDMMVHSWSTMHIRITYVDKDTGRTGYLNPRAWSRSKSRWSSHADMLKQYAACIADRVKEHDIDNVELYFDVWRSLNDRFQQRMFDPREDMVTAQWHPLKETPWLMPLLTDLSDWRRELDRIEQEVYMSEVDTDVVFIADFPGLYLENYIQPELKETNLTVLKGTVILELVDQNINITLVERNVTAVPAGEFHNVYTISDEPSCFMYTFINATELELSQNITEYEKAKREMQDSTMDAVIDDELTQTDQDQYYEQLVARKQTMASKRGRSLWQRFRDFVREKAKTFHRGAVMTRVALLCIVTGRTFEDVFNTTLGMDFLNDDTYSY